MSNSLSQGLAALGMTGPGAVEAAGVQNGHAWDPVMARQACGHWFLPNSRTACPGAGGGFLLIGRERNRGLVKVLGILCVTEALILQASQLQSLEGGESGIRDQGLRQGATFNCKRSAMC